MATFCVNTNSANFQNLVNEYNIDPLSLEVTIFQWMKDNDKVWSEENNNELRDYIENEYSINKTFNVESKEMFDAYSKLHDAVSQTGSMSKEDALDLYSKVSQAVGDSNASLYMDNEGNWNVNMKMPSYQGMTSEMQQIKDQTIKDGTFMKAPNGNPTNLTERQWLQVRTKAFKEWFGDWENDPANASIVVDENGEPLVVYHSSKVTDISSFKNYIERKVTIDKNQEWIYNMGIEDWIAEGYEITKEQINAYNEGKEITIEAPNIPNAIYASSNYEVSKDYQRNIQNEEEPEYVGKTYSLFLNIRDAEIINADGKNWNKIEYNGEIHSTRTLESLFRGKKDGLIIKNVFDLNSDALLEVKYNLGTTYIVYNPNQIKSATDNVGTFSPENDDIRYNQEMSELFDVIDYIAKQTFEVKLGNGEKVRHRVLSRFNDQYYLPLQYADEKWAIDKLETYLLVYDLPFNLIEFNRTKGGRLVAHINENALQDAVERNEANAEIGDLFNTPEETQSVTTVLNKLSAITGLKYKTITESEANELVKGKDFSSTNAFVYNDTCYFIQGRKLNTDIAAEEMLHPFIAAVRKYNPKAFDSLLRDARRAFPKLRLEVAKTYNENNGVRDEELVTQALSRAFRKDIKDNPEGHKLKNLIKHFIDYIRDVFRSFVNINGKTTQYFTNIDNILQNKEVKAEDLANNIKIEELAKVINSDIEKLESDTKVFRQNLETSEKKQLLTESKIKERGYFKRGETKISYNFTNNLQNSKETKVAARRTTDNSGNNVINLDIDFLRQKYNEKSWNKPYIQPDNSVAEPLDENIFTSFDEFLTFVVLHEYYHTQRKINEGETRGEYETTINNLALQDLKNNYTNADQNQTQQQPVFEQSKEATAEETNADEIVIEQNTLDEHASDMQEAFGEYDKTPVLNKTSSALKTAFDNLNSRGKLFPQKEKQHIAKVIVNYVSSLINNIKESGFEAVDAIYNDPYTEDLNDTMFINFPTDENINYKAMSRSEIINRVGLVNLLNYVKERYINPDMHFNLNDDKAENLRLAYDNWPAMLLMANKDMILCEGYTIDARFDTIEYGSDTEDIKGDFQADEQEVGETEAWGVRARSIPARNSISVTIRREIRLTPVYDKNGKIISDEFGYGFDSYCNPDALVNILYAKLHNCANLTQMKEVLTKYKSAFPEFQSILDKLNANKEFEDLFFSNFSKGQSLFYVVTKIYDEAAKRYVFKPIAINIGNFQTKFKNALIEKKYNGSLDLWNVTRVGDKYKFTESSYNDAINTLKKINEIRDTLKTSKSQDTLSQAITDFLDIFGIKNLFGESSIQAMAEDKSVLNVIESQLKTIYVKLDLELQDVKLKGVNNKETFSISEYSTDSNSIGAQLNKLAEALEEYAPVAIEPIAHENGKTYCAYSNPSLLDIISRKIHNDKEFDKFMEEEFKPSLMFYDSENDVWYNDVLAKMNSVSKSERTAARETFRHAVMLSFGDKDYIDMGETPLEACNILNYFIDTKGNKAYYKIPIPSDKNEFGFLMFYKKGQRQEFIDTFYDNVCQELIRINTVLRRSFKKEAGKIDFYDIDKNVFEGVKSFKDLTQSQYIEKFTSEKFSNTGAAFRYFPFLSRLITDESSPLGRMLFAKMKGEKLENETAFRAAIEEELENGMLEIVDEEVNKFYTDGLFEFETTWEDSPAGKYPVYQNRFLAQLHDTRNQITSDIEKAAGEIKKDSKGNVVKDSKGNEIYEIKNWRLTPAAIVKKGITDTLDPKFINYLVGKEVIIENNGIYSFNETTPAVKYGELLNMNESLRDQLYKMEMTQQVESKLREYAWGNYYGRINITQLLVTDPSYFGDADKFQKRFSMSHSPGVRANLDATVKVGESKVKVTDGVARTITLRDNKVASPAAEEVRNFYIQRAEKSEGAEKAFYLQCANDAYNALSSINQTDAQALSSLTAMRKKMAMFAKWNDEFENAYQKIRANKGNWKIMQETLHDISGALSPLKPFVGANTIVPSGVVETAEDAGAMANMRVPVMHKNSDYLLLMTDALMQSEGQKSILSELYRFMEDTHYDENGNYKTDGIDTIQFESAVKVGGKDALDVTDATADNMYEKLQNHTYDEKGQYKENSVIKYSYEYYSVQQETPNHMRDHKQLIGSQQRILVTADQNPDGEIKVDGKKIKVKEAIDEYFKLHAANIYDSEQQLLGELLIDKDAFVKDLNRCIVKADKEDTKEDSENKLKTLLDLNYKNLPKSVKNKIINAYHKAAENYHGYVQAKDLVFHISQAERNECLSLIIKDAVINDAKFDSDMLVGCTVDENGKFTIPIDDAIQSARIEQLLFSIIKSRINKQTIKGGPAVQVSSFGIANDLRVVYKMDSNGKNIGVDYMEIYVTCPSKELEDRLTIRDKDGKFVRLMTPEEALKAKKITENELKAIGYRIPTEDTYSIIPLKIKGFLPRFAGDAVMLPAEHVAITGSDFDIDKFYLMFRENSKNRNSKQGRNDRIFDIEYALLQTQESMEKMMNPGNFDTLKKLSASNAELRGIKKENMNPMMQKTDSYFYGQNTAAKKLIGVMANATTSHAFLSFQDIWLQFDIPFMCEGEHITSLKLDPIRNRKGKLISKVLGSGIGAAADAAKDPVFKNLNITPATVNVAALLFRTGFSEDFVARFLAQPSLVKAVNEYEKRNSYEKASIKKIIYEKLKAVSGETPVNEFVESNIMNYNFTESEFKNNLNPSKEGNEIDIRALCLFYSLLDPASDVNTLTFLTKFNSITNAAGPTIAEELAMERRMVRFAAEGCPRFLIYNDRGDKIHDNPIDAIKNNPILKAFYSTTIGYVGSAYSGQEEDGAVRQIMGQYFPQFSSGFQALLENYDDYSTSKLNEDGIEKLYKFYLLYHATTIHKNGEIPAILDGSAKGRKQFASRSFIETVLKIKSENPDNTLLNAYSVKEKTVRCPIDVIDTDINGGSSDFNDLIGGDWADMLNDEKQKDLAISLALYSIYRGGLRYSPKTPLHTAKSDIKLQLKGYTDLLEYLAKDTDTRPEFINGLISQFKRNNSHDTSIVPEFYVTKGDNNVSVAYDKGTLTITGKQSNIRIISTQGASESIESVIKYKDDVYEFSSKITNDDGSISLMYHKTTKLGIKSNFIEVDANEGKNIKTIFTNSFNDNEGYNTTPDNPDGEQVTEFDLLKKKTYESSTARKSLVRLLSNYAANSELEKLC